MTPLDVKSSREITIFGDGPRVYDKGNLSTLERIARIKDDVIVVNSFLEDYRAEHFSKEQLVLLKDNLEAINKKLLLSIKNVDSKMQLHGIGPEKPITRWQRIKNFFLELIGRRQLVLIPAPPISSWNTGVLETRPEVIRALKE